ncbi:MAG: heparan-alpha-glucosaminide N-acetyltransferase domain-containing protein, partial [Pseudomonadota bacterium]|nr:heparan-alpha-glucosaminide N-acetyltransferase domain-containing protein [Pseudomonadota bacterium]
MTTDRSLIAPPAAPTLPTGGARSSTGRIPMIDRLRGLMVVFMVLDHVREFMHRDALLFQPTDLDKTNAALFATRWVTHLCAPTFVLLAGVSIRLQRERAVGGLGRHLVARGLWLLLLEATVISFGFDLGWPFLFLQVIWAIGVGMLVMAASLRFRPALVLLVAIVAFFVSGLIPAGAFGPLSFLLRPAPMTLVPGLVAYPLVPWVAILAIGYGAGDLFLPGAWKGRSAVRAAGVALLAAFVALRITGIGDPVPWEHRPTIEGSILSFLNVSKYPPSPAFVCATLGVSLTLAPLLRRLPWPLSSITDAFGRTPFFTY